jgi:serine/threonine protein kinase
MPAMPLAAGSRLGPYEVISIIGAGGMGEVYRAVDPRLGREVAIKVSAAQFTERFEREARAVAALNHPNICHVYDVGPNYLVMELVDGESPKGPLRLETALNYARQLADALEAAHAKGIVHRDLKPGNIKVTRDGTVKVLDFGLAKVVETSSAANLENSPTISIAATGAGMILGTAGYMAPEQVRGEAVDAQADIWAFGVVLYEMLTGSRAFEGKTISDTLAAVLMKEPDVDSVPYEVRPLIRRCLAKDPKQRLRHAGDVRLLLDEKPLVLASAIPPTQRRSKRSSVAMIVCAILALALVLLGFFHFSERSLETPVVRFEVVPPGNAAFGETVRLSPDGKHLAFIANGPNGTNQLWIRSLDTVQSKALPGTDGAVPAFFWSPDSKSIAYATFGNTLKRVDISGGPPQTILELGASYRGGAWSDGPPEARTIIVGSTGRGLIQMPATGGMPKPLTVRDTGEHSAPVFLPGQRNFLYDRTAHDNEPEGIYIGSLDIPAEQQSSKRLFASDSGPMYAPIPNSPVGYILFRRETALMAQAFDADRLALVGEQILLAEGIMPGLGPTFSASGNGVLSFRTGVAQRRTLSWFERSGTLLKTTGDPADYNLVSLSPDGTQVAVSRIDSGNTDVWINEIEQGNTRRLTFDSAAESYPVWSPNGSEIIFASDRNNSTLVRKAASGAGPDQTVYSSNDLKYAQDWSRDGQFLLYSVGTTSNFDLWMLQLGPKPAPQKYIATEFTESQGRFSPDGRYVAYSSNASGRNEVYVQTFPNPSQGKWMISVNGGSAPRWRSDGKELFYISADSKIMAVDVSTTPTFAKQSAPKVLFSAPIYGGGTTTNVTRYDVTPDGQRFLINTERSQSPTEINPITVILNWPALLKR